MGKGIGSREVIEARVKAMGGEVVDIMPTSGRYPNVKMRCKEGHLLHANAGSLKRVPYCKFCAGTSLTAEDFLNVLKEKDLRAPNYETAIREDTYGNKYILANARIGLICREGHDQVAVLREIRGENPVCKTCKGTNWHIGFSRSEEIIARILEHSGVAHIRQYPMDDAYFNRKLDFFLPDLGVIIEYDGVHHKYGRNDSGPGYLERVREEDRMRDHYATSNGYRMLRIDHSNQGRRIAYVLAQELPEARIDPHNPIHDSIVEEVTNLASDLYGWDSYDTFKDIADLRMAGTLQGTADALGMGFPRVNNKFRYVYGMAYTDYMSIDQKALRRKAQGRQ